MSIDADPRTRARAIRTTPAGPPRVLMADRGDPLVAALTAAMSERFEVVGRLDTELTAAERLLVAASTFRPVRRHWSERFHKSNLAVGLRSQRARTLLGARAGRAQAHRADVIFQTHALFEVADPRTVLYVDCTHRQSMAQWPDWNPLRGRSLDRWLARERRQYQDAAHVFAFSEVTATSIVEQYDVPPAQVSVVGAGLNFGGLPDVVERPGTTDGHDDPDVRPPTVLFVGHDFERKGGPQLLAAFADLRRRVPAARLRIVGAAPAIPDQPGVEVLGRVDDRDRLARMYADADVFCLPSLYDPFPGALLEAMSFGLPSVVTASCGVPEIVGDAGTAVTVGRGPTMAAELADALEHLLLDRDAATRMGRAARRRVETTYTWAHVVDRMAPHLERVSAEGRAT